MASMASKPHFVLVPLMAQGHMIPVIDMARLIAQRGIIISLVTTPHNASRFEKIIHRAKEFGLEIHLVQIPFPCQEVGLPIGYENLDTLPSKNLLKIFYKALAKLEKPLETFLENTNPFPSCIISDKCLSWTSKIAIKFNIPRIVFHGMGCFSLLSAYNVKKTNAHLSVSSDSESFIVPNMPLMNFQVKRCQLPGSFISLPDLDDVRNKMQEAESEAFGVVINSFNELENGCFEAYKRAVNKKVWCIGPVSLCNQENLDKFERGNKASIDENKCKEFLDSKKERSVIYVCLGSLCRLEPSQLIELGFALEESKKPFIWVAKTGEKISELEEWFKKEKFEERNKKNGLIIKGWAPQVLILSHKSIGGFLTHCGWNSTIESVCSGIPMITWPLFAEQFFNEILIVEILKIGIRVGVEIPVRWGDEEKLGVLVKKNEIKNAINLLMEDSEDGEIRRNKAYELGIVAKKSMEFGGSSYGNLSVLIQDVLHEVELRRKRERMV